MAYAQLSPDALGTVVTYLEQTDRQAPSAPPESSLRLVRLEEPALDQYRNLFRRVGENWLWFDRLTLNDDDLRQLIHHPAVEIHAVISDRGERVGMLELHFQPDRAAKIAYVGLVPQLVGQGHGRWLLWRALQLAWRHATRRVTVNTCTFDHPAALRSYLRAGFRLCGRAVWTFPDPRLRGILPRGAAPHIPLLVFEVPPGSSTRPKGEAGEGR